MRRRNLIAAMIAGAALWMMGGAASAQFAELPFLTDELAPPNVHWFIDNSGYLNQIAKQDALKRKQFEVFRDVMAGTKEFIYYQGLPVFTPYYSNTVDSYWLGDDLVVVMPKIIRLRRDFEGYVPDSGGEFFMFYYRGDPFAQDLLVESALTTIDAYMRDYTQETDTEYYLQKVTEAGTLSIDDFDGGSTTHSPITVWSHTNAAGMTDIYGDIVARYWGYEETGEISGSEENLPTFMVVPVRHQPADRFQTYTDPAGTVRTGVCNMTRQWQPCYWMDEAANTAGDNFSFIIWDSHPNRNTAEWLRLDHHESRTITFTDWYNMAGRPAAYCRGTGQEVFGDAPVSAWSTDRHGNVTTDGYANEIQTYYACDGTGDNVVERIGADFSDEDILLEIEAAIPYANVVDIKWGRTTFTKSEATGERMDIFLRRKLGITPTNPPIENLIWRKPWFGGFFDGLLYHAAFYGSPGIMDIYREVNYGLQAYEKDTACYDADGNFDDFPPDDSGRCFGSDLEFNPTSWADFAAYPATNNQAENKKIQEWIRALTHNYFGGTAPIASFLHDFYRFFWNTDMDAPMLDGRPHPLDTTDPSMFFDLGFPDPRGEPGYPLRIDHIIQGDPFYKNLCRRNYLIMLTGGRQLQGEDVHGDSSGSYHDQVMQTQAYWIQRIAAVTGPFAQSNIQRRKLLGCKSFFIGFGMDQDKPGREQLEYMAAHSVMDPVAAALPPDNPDHEISYPLLATTEAELRAAIKFIMDSIMAGQYARTAPELSVSEGALITNFFEITGAARLWRGHVLAFGSTQEEVIEGDTTYYAYPRLWQDTPPYTGDAGHILNETAAADRRILTATGEGADLTRRNFTLDNKGVLCSEFYPHHDCSSAKNLDLSEEIIKFIRGDNNATFSDGQSQYWRLGATYHSKPRVVAPPRSFTYYYFPGYQEFAAQYASRPTMVMVGTMYGMLHSFLLHDSGGFMGGEELFAYVPTNQLPLLHHLRNGDQIFGVDGTAVIRDLYFPDDEFNEDRDLSGTIEHYDRWHTVLMAGLGGGGTHYFAIDITDADTTTNRLDKIKPLWNFRDDRLAFTWSVPVLGLSYNRDSPTGYMPSAFFGGGLQELLALQDPGIVYPNKGGWFYVVNAQDGSLIKSFKFWDIDEVKNLTDMSTVEEGDNYNMIPGSPIMFDNRGDNIFDRAYIGDYQGRLWKVNLAGGDTTEWTQCILRDMADVDGDGTLGGDDDLADDQRRPVWYSPALARGPNNALLVYFFTGHVEMKSSAIDEDQRNYFYALVDEDADHECSYAVPLLKPGTDEPLMIEFEPGEKPIGDILVTAEQVIFKTFLPITREACAPGTVRLWAFHYLTGEGAFTDEFGEPIQYIEVSSLSGVVLTPEGKIVAIDDEGNPIVEAEVPASRAQPMSWGEGVIF